MALRIGSMSSASRRPERRRRYCLVADKVSQSQGSGAIGLFSLSKLGDAAGEVAGACRYSACPEQESSSAADYRPRGHSGSPGIGVFLQRLKVRVWPPAPAFPDVPSPL